MATGIWKVIIASGSLRITDSVYGVVADGDLRNVITGPGGATPREQDGGQVLIDMLGRCLGDAGGDAGETEEGGLAQNETRKTGHFVYAAP